MTFEVLLSADALVPDHDLALARVSSELGVQRLEERHVVRNPAERAVWSFPRVHPNRSLAPTNLEFLQVLPDDGMTPISDDYSFIPEIAAAQGDRPSKLHSTPVGVIDLDAVIERLDCTEGRYRLHEATDALPFRRLWVGFTSDGTGTYLPETDGGLHLELVPARAHRLPAQADPAPTPNRDGTIIRVLARTILVDDLSETRRAVDQHFGVDPPPLGGGPDGVARATLPFGNPRSARLEILQPGPDGTGFETDLFRRWGPGPCSIRFAVDGLDAFRERQLRSGLELVPAAPLDDVPRLLRPLDPVLGNAYEFVEWDGS